MKAAPAPPERTTESGSPGGESLEGLFARVQGELLGTLYYLVGNLEDARDALQETFLKCWQHREEWGQVTNGKAWVFRVALNTGRDLRRSAWRRRRQPWGGDGDMLTSTSAATHERLAEQEELARVQSAVHALRSEEQEVFLLRQNGELTYEEIAAEIGVPLGTVKTRMRLALSRLRVALGEPAT
jgi:RNA polymerase sigma-70 factor (ECF subfamily)